MWREEIKKQRQKPNFVVLELIEQRELLCHSRELIEEGVCLTKAKALFYIFELQGVKSLFLIQSNFFWDW